MSPSYFVRRNIALSHSKKEFHSRAQKVYRSRIILIVLTIVVLLLGFHGVFKQIVQ
ncbi:MAG: hypothetical protein ACRC37_04905 [Lentisphaeria bacterium]